MKKESHKERMEVAEKKHERHEKRARGGGMHQESKAEEEKKEHEKRKHGGHVGGKKPEHRLDKRARGGRMTPSSPLSGADAPNLSYAHGDLKSGSEGMGKDKT